MTCGLLTASSCTGSDGMTASCPGVRSAGTRPGILTGVLEATVRDPQVRTPAARLNYGFVSHRAPASRAARPLLSPAPRDGTSPGPDAAAAQPAATGTDPDFHAARPPKDEMAKLSRRGSFLARGQVDDGGAGGPGQQFGGVEAEYVDPGRGRERRLPRRRLARSLRRI